MAIPVENIYYLLCYAWDRLDARDLVPAGAIPGNRVENLLGHVLRSGVSDLIRRGLDRGYVSVAEEERQIHGKLLLTQTIQRVLLPQGRVACLVDELSYDVPHNRIIKAAMTALLSVPELDHDIRAGLKDHQRRMHDVANVSLSGAAFRQVQLHSNLTRYTFLINICRLIALSFMPDDDNGGMRFHPFTASEQEMGRVFEAFIRNFLRREQHFFTVSSPKVQWSLESASGSDPSWLPDMQTDIVLADARQRIVVEAKYYATPYQSHYGSKKLISGHLYQLMAYLSQLRAGGESATAGVLLYAGAAAAQGLDYRLAGHHVLIRGIALDQDWEAIHQRILGLGSELAEISQVARHKLSAQEDSGIED